MPEFPSYVLLSGESVDQQYHLFLGKPTRLWRNDKRPPVALALGKLFNIGVNIQRRTYKR